MNSASESSDQVATQQETSDPTNNNRFILYVWPGEWNLPSLDPECLTAIVSFNLQK
jgi:hypothetical protein